MARRRLTDAQVAELRPEGGKRTLVPDPGLAGFYVRISPSGGKSYVCVARPRGGAQVWRTIGPTDSMLIEAARAKAVEIIDGIRRGTTVKVPAGQLGEVAERWLREVVEGRGYRTSGESRRIVYRHILPLLGADTPLLAIQRQHLAAMMDEIANASGGRSADRALSVFGSLRRWYARNVNGPPIDLGDMSRDHAPPRSRILTDQEIAAVWHACTGAFGDIVKIALLTAQRRELVRTMKWADIDADGIWSPPVEARAKQHGGPLQLSALALAIIRARPRLVGNPHVFARRAGTAFNDFAASKRRLDKASGVTSWVLHDLRRTARSLLSQLRVSRDISERVLGHKVGSAVEQVYDRFEYGEAKADALARLAAYIERLVEPATNVVELPKASHAGAAVAS